MRFALLAVVQIVFLFRSMKAIDPFEGNFPVLHCLKPRQITGCNETLLEAYKRTNLSNSDQNINDANIFFYLFTCDNQEDPEFLHECGGRLPSNTNFRTGAKTVFIVPGYISHVCDMAWLREMKDQYFCRCHREPINVILVDWPCCNGVDYYSASRNTRVVGKQMCLVIKNIIEQTGVSQETFHLIGHSLGSHICGFAGKCLKDFGIKVGRITALDPAGVNFIDEEPQNRLHKDDAESVDAIHSNAGQCFPLALGYPYQIGHADFWPNGGSVQLSCYPHILISLLKGDIYYAFVLLLGPFCPHFQSVQYFKESINGDCCGCQYVGVECASSKDFESGKCRSCGADGSKCAVMGEHWKKTTDQNSSRSYYLNTGLLCPYCTNKGIRFQGFPRNGVAGNTSLDCVDPGKKYCC